VLSLVGGVIATSPLIEQATPASKIAKWVGGKISNVLPYTLIPAPVNAEVRSLLASASTPYAANVDWILAPISRSWI